MQHILESFKNNSLRKNCIIFGTTFAIIVIIALSIFISKGSGKVLIDVENSLKEVITCSEMKTVEFTYNSIAEAKDEDNTKYYVSYKGRVTASFDLDSVSILKYNKDIIISIPDIQLDDPYIIPGSLDFIFLKNKYENETVSAEALTLCANDLKNKSTSNKTLIKSAEDSARSALLALTKPFESQLDVGGKFIVAIGDEVEEYK